MTGLDFSELFTALVDCLAVSGCVLAWRLLTIGGTWCAGVGTCTACAVLTESTAL